MFRNCCTDLERCHNNGQWLISCIQFANQTGRRRFFSVNTKKSLNVSLWCIIEIGLMSCMCVVRPVKSILKWIVCSKMLMLYSQCPLFFHLKQNECTLSDRKNSWHESEFIVLAAVLCINVEERLFFEHCILMIAHRYAFGYI